jgi:hypothetical protein
MTPAGLTTTTQYRGAVTSLGESRSYYTGNGNYPLPTAFNVTGGGSYCQEEQLVQ